VFASHSEPLSLTGRPYLRPVKGRRVNPRTGALARSELGASSEQDGANDEDTRSIFLRLLQVEFRSIGAVHLQSTFFATPTVSSNSCFNVPLFESFPLKLFPARFSSQTNADFIYSLNRLICTILASITTNNWSPNLACLITVTKLWPNMS